MHYSQWILPVFYILEKIRFCVIINHNLNTTVSLHLSYYLKFSGGTIGLNRRTWISSDKLFSWLLFIWVKSSTHLNETIFKNQEGLDFSFNPLIGLLASGVQLCQMWESYSQCATEDDRASSGIDRSWTMYTIGLRLRDLEAKCLQRRDRFWVRSPVEGSWMLTVK